MWAGEGAVCRWVEGELCVCVCVCVCVCEWRGSCVCGRERELCVGGWRGSCV